MIIFFLIMAKQHFFESKKPFSRCRLANQDFSLIANQSIFFSIEKKHFFKWKESFPVWMRRLLFVYTTAHGSSDTSINFIE